MTEKLQAWNEAWSKGQCQWLTRTTRTPAFWGYPPPPHDYPYHWVILDPKSKEDNVKVTNLQKFAKISNFWILKWALHATHLLKLLDKMCKYEMDPMSILEDTERTQFCPQTDRRTRWYQYTPYQLRWSGGYNKNSHQDITAIFYTLMHICNTSVGVSVGQLGCNDTCGPFY